MRKWSQDRVDPVVTGVVAVAVRGLAEVKSGVAALVSEVRSAPGRESKCLAADISSTVSTGELRLGRHDGCVNASRGLEEPVHPGCVGVNNSGWRNQRRP
jgi:hypothetical protein